MANRKQVRRREVFERQAAALGHFVYGTTRSVILCPLCLHLWEEQFLTEEGQLTIEDAPPVQYGGGTQRCVTCWACNTDAGGDFESHVKNLNTKRAMAVEAAQRGLSRQASGLWGLPKLPAVPLSLVEATELASVHPEERQLELKSAYLIAFATLGYSYILGQGLDTVRHLIQPGADAGSIKVCAKLNGLPAEPRVRVALTPIECVVVSHPTQHKRTDEGHVVFLPLPGSTDDFYDRLKWLPPRSTWTFYGEYPHPRVRRLPMRWDHYPAHPFRATDTWRAECDCGPELQHEPIDVRLSQAHLSAGTSEKSEER